MRRYYIVSWIFLVLPIIDFALAAPALVPEERQAGVDVAHIPEDAVTTLVKRGGTEALDNLMLQKLEKASTYFNDDFVEPEAKRLKPKPNSKPSNSGPSNQGPSNSEPSNQRPPSDPGSSNPVSSDQWALEEWQTGPESKRPKVRWFIGRQAQS